MTYDLANEIYQRVLATEKTESITVQTKLLVRKYTCCLDHSMYFHIYSRCDNIKMTIENDFACDFVPSSKFTCRKTFAFAFDKRSGLNDMKTVCRAFVKELVKSVLLKTGLVDHYNRFSEVFVENKIIQKTSGDCSFATSTNLTDVFTKNILSCGTQVSPLAYDIMFENVWDALSIAIYMKPESDVCE